MAEEVLLAGLSLESITVDEEGRIVIKDAKLRERLKANAAARSWGGTPNVNCHGCNGTNYEPGCGVRD